MALSTKVISAYKETFNSVIQVEKEARVALRTQALLFSLQVREHAIKIMEAQKRKSLKLCDVVTGVAAQLAIEFPSMQIDNFVDSIFGSSVPYSVGKSALGDKIFTYSTFTDAQTARLFINNEGHVQINHKNTLRVSEIERALATSRKAHRTANAFLAICADQYVQNLLSAAEARVTHDNKKRVKVEHLNLFSCPAEFQERLAEFKAAKVKVEPEADEPKADEPEADESVAVGPAPVFTPEPAPEPASEPASKPAAPEPASEPAPAKKGRGKKTAPPAVEEAPAKQAEDTSTTAAAPEPPAKKIRVKKTA